MKGKRNSLKRKLLRTSVGVTAVLMLVVFGTFFQYYMHFQKKILDEQVRILSENVVERVNSAFSSLDDISLQLSTNSYIVQTMQQLMGDSSTDNVFEDDLRMTQYLQSFIWSYIIRGDVATRICIYNQNGDFLNTGSSAYSATDIQRYIAAERLEELNSQFARGDKVIWQVHAEDPLWKGANGYVCAIREIRDTQILSSPPLGYVEVQLSLNKIEKTLLKLRQEDFALQVEEAATGMVVIEDSAMMPGVQSRFTCELPTENGVLLCRLFSGGSMLYQARNTMLIALVMVFVILVLIMAVALHQGIGRVMQPLLELFEQTRQSGLQELPPSQRGPVLYDEVTGLRQAFEEMLASLRHSSDELVAAQTGKMRAQLLAMQAQTDPHFIHNTLAVIASLAREGRVEKAEDVITRLSAMIRYSTSFEQPVCTMKQEIEHLQNYLELLSIRYEECFVYSISGNGMTSECQVPRFITQPIAENSLRHSLKYTEYPWEITVRCEVNAYEWRIILCDSGQGITAEKSSEVMQQIAIAIRSGVDNLVEQLKIGKLSLLNIAARLYLNYGDEMVFCIGPDETGGTKVILGGSIR